MKTVNLPEIRAVWITDQEYAAITLLSISSFLEQADASVSLIFTGKTDDPSIRKVFESLSPRLDWMHFYPQPTSAESRNNSVVVNRLARVHALRSFPDEVVLLLDSDTAYSDGLAKHLHQLQSEIVDLDPEQSHVFGVIEHRRAWDAGLFFQPSGQSDWQIPISSGLKEKILLDVFGAPASRLQSFPQYNNGILAFYQGHLVADLWQQYYQNTVENAHANLFDDQLSLAVVMYDQNLRFNELPAAWNSLGRWDGEYFAWHPWAGKWKTDLVVLFNGESATSSFGKILERQLDKLPEPWRKNLEAQVLATPAYCKAFPGAFLYRNSYREIVALAGADWKMVEIGKYYSPSTFFMAELIRTSGKRIHFDALREFPRANWSGEEMKAHLKLSGLDAFVQLKEGSPDQWLSDYRDESLDFICYDRNLAAKTYQIDLANWYAKLKPGGWMTGFDESIYETFGADLNSTVMDFCRKKRIPCQCDGQVFLFRKPLIPVTEIELSI